MDWLEGCVQEAEGLPLATRQYFLDLMWAGKTIGEAQSATGITFEAANGILRQNIEQRLDAAELSLSRRAV